MLQSWRKLYAKSENTQAYSLLSPALILVAVAMLVPMMLMLSFSFFTQVSMSLRGIPWCLEAMKGVVTDEISRGVGNKL